MWRRLLSFVLIFSLVGGLVGAQNTYAAGSLTLYTPYTGLSVTPGETITYNVDVINNGSNIQNATFDVQNLPKGWEYTITSGGNNVKQLSIQPSSQQQIMLEVTVPLKVEKAEYNFDLTASANGGESTNLPILVNVSEKGTFKTELTTDQPNLEGSSDSNFSYTATLKNRTAEKQNYALNSQPPKGWNVEFKVDGKSVTSVSLEPNGSKDIDINITPAKNAKADTYQIPIKAATSSTSADLQIESVITGTYGLNLTTPTGKLSTDITAGGDKTIKFVVENSGSANLTNIKLSASAPPNWKTEFDTDTIQKLEAGQKTTVQATITAPDDTIAGDYVTTFTAGTAESSSDATFRISVETSTLWGFIGVLIILAVLGGLYYIFRKYGRR
ncbi:NEW3 domain-containing protein [Aquibacillus sp. 3ASR75-11]|uniref:NEW3 domain-containing protein n=1 Tax=Terrihalobacillus insolitus TaxID=2950438 RepID=A0A9X3WXR6_9BACI|nr:NEW3 domain-containing protein [Terrihalobacillus insolitus]MDC3413470.1 NEW3 domain-containing protein [Terrihalobacillus insolitus]MDC3425239.1 NEW3 domain-containing protein [Terrihalobacillus insolitus]